MEHERWTQGRTGAKVCRGAMWKEQRSSKTGSSGIWGKRKAAFLEVLTRPHEQSDTDAHTRTPPRSRPVVYLHLLIVVRNLLEKTSPSRTRASFFWSSKAGCLIHGRPSCCHATFLTTRTIRTLKDQQGFLWGSHLPRVIDIERRMSDVFASQELCAPWHNDPLLLDVVHQKL